MLRYSNNKLLLYFSDYSQKWDVPDSERSEASTDQPSEGFTKLMESVNNYQKGIHNTVVAFKCPNCGNGYTHKSSLARHMRLECGKDPQFQCPHCHHRTKHKSSLLTHIENRHKPPLIL